MAMCSANLTDLPVEMLEEIVSYLGYEDRVSLAWAHRNLLFLWPREQSVEARRFTSGSSLKRKAPVIQYKCEMQSYMYFKV